MRLFFTLAVALMATAGTTGCQTAICTNCTSAMPQTIAPTGSSDCDEPACDGNAAGDAKTACDGNAACDTPVSENSVSSDCGCTGSQTCDDKVDCGCGGASCASGNGLAGVPTTTPVRNLAARVRARAESGAACADGSCGTGEGACADGSCGSGQSTSLFGGLFRRPSWGASGSGHSAMGGGHGGGYAHSGTGHGGMGHGGMGHGGMGHGGMGHGGYAQGGMGQGGMGHGGMGHGGMGQGGMGHGGLGQGGLGQGGLGLAGLGRGGLGRGGMGRGGMGGCGVQGCGIAGRLCGRCGGAGNEHPYGGMSPHTPQMAGPFGPMSATYGYPYYTTRGPRDFFMDNPPSLGR